jgi:S-adenosylmethionine decarboxylase
MQTKRYHNIFDLENCNEKIGNAKIIREFVIEIAKTVDMSILEGPIVAEGAAINPGLSALAIIDFSHISIHTFIKFNEALIDVFSCKPYEKNKVLEVCLKYFGSPETKVREKEIWWG